MNSLRTSILSTFLGVAVLASTACKDDEREHANSVDGEANNVEIFDGNIYATLGSFGISVTPFGTQVAAQTLPPPVGTTAFHDLSFSDGFLFGLDAREGFLSVFDATGEGIPTLTSGPTLVEVGPFAGVSAANGFAVVSGGTGLLSVFNYNDQGQLSQAFSTVDLGRGQPDVLLHPELPFAFVSTHFDKEHFGITLLTLNTPPAPPTVLGSLEIPGAGFTGGTASPANFPIESAIHGDLLMTAAGPGLFFFRFTQTGDTTAQLAALLKLDLPMEAINVDVYDGQAYVVGSEPQPAICRVELTTPALNGCHQLPENLVPTGVAVSEDGIAIASNAGGVFQMGLDGSFNAAPQTPVP